MVEYIPPKKKTGKVESLYAANGDTFVSQSVSELPLTYAGIDGDIHAGITRASGGREPWYPRGTEMRNERQLSILSSQELIDVAKDMNLEEIRPEWIGGNMVLSGIPFLSQLPPRTLLFFEGGVTIRIDGDNGPCGIAGRSIAAHLDSREDVEFAFPKLARHRRGVVGWVEREGTITPGETVTARIWEQCIYPG